jgi:hypothetical protein
MFFLKSFQHTTILSNTIDIKDEENFQLFPRHWHNCCPSQSLGSSWEEVKGWDPPKLAEDPWAIRNPFVSGSEKIEHSWSMLIVGFPFFGRTMSPHCWSNFRCQALWLFTVDQALRENGWNKWCSAFSLRHKLQGNTHSRLDPFWIPSAHIMSPWYVSKLGDPCGSFHTLPNREMMGSPLRFCNPTSPWLVFVPNISMSLCSSLVPLQVPFTQRNCFQTVQPQIR